MKEKIRELLQLNQVIFRVGMSDCYDYLIYALDSKIYIKIKVYFDDNLNPCYSLRVKVVFDNFDKYVYDCLSDDLQKCVLFFERIMLHLGVFPEYD